MAQAAAMRALRVFMMAPGEKECVEATGRGGAGRDDVTSMLASEGEAGG
jgi:hypothetical protein